MANNNKIGEIGEQKAVDFLVKNGYSIVARNWRFKRAEVDIIAQKDAILVFVEVKTRSYNYFGEPEEFVTPQKEALLNAAAAAYMEATHYSGEIRFDIIAILLQRQTPIIKHYEDAFFPEW
ncbi:MAG: YraN family protein [Saprospiraceae bacterium]|nr:YraN family protein [Saprospiraceae bacterium]MBP7679493.1 YraN family protein [Saprospiraceae bacterium]